jgi:hypothetical protein
MKINSKKKNFDGFIEIDFQNQSKNNSNNKKKHKENSKKKISKKKISKNCNNINKEKSNTNIPNDTDPFMKMLTTKEKSTAPHYLKKIFEIEEIAEDGHCLFRAILLGNGLDGDQVTSLRETIADWLEAKSVTVNNNFGLEEFDMIKRAQEIREDEWED